MKEQLHKDDVSYLDFSDVDSTSVISDSLVAVMRGRGPKGIHYQERSSKSLLHIRAKYLFGADTCSTTFYLNPETSGIVAYKDN